jgi:hypothetical protein
MSPANQIRRNVMLMAWDTRRAIPGRSFAECLRDAWKYEHGLTQACANLLDRARRNGGYVSLSPSLVQSPIRRATTSHRYGGRADYRAAYTTARLGA